MERGLYVAAAGMLSELTRQDLLANDLANANTPGYKADRVAQRAFADELALINQRNGRPVGALGTGAEIAAQVTDTAPTSLRETGEPLDLAIQGDGFFSVQTPEGLRYTRDGSFRADAQGRLVDQLGALVVGAGGGPVLVRADGSVDPATVAVTVLDGVAKAGDGRYVGNPAAGQAGTVRTGALESSGVDAARTMVDMMASMRAFEAGQKAIQTIDETLRQATTQVGSIRG